MAQPSTIRFVTDGTYSIEQARGRLESQGVLTAVEEGGWKYVSDDPTFPTVYFLPSGVIEMHGHGLDEAGNREKYARQLGKLLGIAVQQVGVG